MSDRRANFLILHALRIKGIADEATLARFSGLSQETVGATVPDLLEENLVLRRSGRLAGLSLTEEGRIRSELLLNESMQNDGHQVAVELFYESFLEQNQRFKQTCTRWQIREEGGIQSPNDHSDFGYDHGIIAELTDIHERTRPRLVDLSSVVERFGTYAVRLEDAHGRILAGETPAFARPLADSYHDGWMELHQDLLITLKRRRAAADGE
jgi:hypothetical protein